MLRACGITSFWATKLTSDEAVAPLAGQLKTSPEDFIVVEVDLAGQRTDASPYDFLKAVSSPLLPVAEGEEDASGTGGSASAVRETENDEDSIPLAESLPSLLSVLDARLVEVRCTREEVIKRSQALTPQQLRSLVVNTIRTSVGASGNRSSGGSSVVAQDAWWESSFPLAQGQTKEQRRLLHFAVRGRYPHIRSVSHGDGGGVDDVYAGVDPLYVFFAFAFGESVADTLAGWAQQKAAATMAMRSPEDAETLLRLEEAEGGDRMDADGTQRSLLRERPVRPSSIVLHTCFPPVSQIEGSSGDDGNGGGDMAAATATLSEKDFRRAFHEILRRFYGYLRCSVRDGRITLAFAPPEGSPRSPEGREGHGKRARDDAAGASAAGAKKRRSESAADVGAVSALRTSGYTHCVVKKVNLDTMEMKTLLAEAYRVKEGLVCMAGMKDKRAVTFQRISLPCDSTTPAFEGERRTLRWPSDPQGSYLDITCSSAAGELPRPIQLGELSGNHFIITLRNIQRQDPQQRQYEMEKKEEEEEARRRSPSLPCARGSNMVEDLQARFALVATHGFVNYFGQQRFSESVTDLRDHTGIHLFAGRYVDAVRSLYRACPEVYDGFPAGMDARHAPRNSRDCLSMTHSLKQSYRMFFSEHELTAADVQGGSDLWKGICEKAICESVPFALRSLWVHAGQSLFFNVAASHAADSLALACREGRRDAAQTQRLAELLWLPMAGYRVDRCRSGEGKPAEEVEAEGLELDRIVAEAEAHALQVLGLSREAVFGGARRVAGVPVPGSWRRVFAVPQDATLTIPPEAGTSSSVVGEAVVSFLLPPSSYATVCLREVLGTDQRW